MSDTIFALSSGHGRSGVAVIRISGPQSDDVLRQFSIALPEYRRTSLGTLRDPISRERLDQGLVLRFARGHSFTGEESCELQVHGGRAVVQSVLRALGAFPGLRQAAAGEFTRRAMENGRIDLTQAEALADLIDADTEQQRRQALRGFEGRLGREVQSWRNDLREIRGMIAADIDFSDEGDVGEESAAEIDSYLERLEAKFYQALQSETSGRIVSDGFRVVLVGAPNSGKSTLLNALAGSDIAIVTEFSGTTRDVLEVRLDLAGYTVVLMDTAGLRESDDPIESIGIERARFAASRADLVLLLDDGQTPLPILSENIARVQSIRIRSKSDLMQDTSRSMPGGFDLSLSAHSGEGLDALRDLLGQHVASAAMRDEPALITRMRHAQAVRKAWEHCRQARTIAHAGIEFIDSEVMAIDHALQELLGTIGVEEVLGEVFSRFCVGK